MNYQTFAPSPELAAMVKCYWTLEVPSQPETQKQLILPDGCVDLCFILGDDIKRYTSGDDYIIQPRQMLLGQITEQFYIEPTGYVNTFAVRFYPYGFANLIDVPLNKLSNNETPLANLFGNEISTSLTQAINLAANTEERITLIERFLNQQLSAERTIDSIVKSTVEIILSTAGSKSLRAILKDDASKRRQLERNFTKQIGLSPKQLSKAIRLQASLQRILNQQSKSLTDIAYESAYFDQAHFIKDFKEFTGVTPKAVLASDSLKLSALFYARD